MLRPVMAGVYLVLVAAAIAPATGCAGDSQPASPVGETTVSVSAFVAESLGQSSDARVSGRLHLERVDDEVVYIQLRDRGYEIEARAVQPLPDGALEGSVVEVSLIRQPDGTYEARDLTFVADPPVVGLVAGLRSEGVTLTIDSTLSTSGLLSKKGQSTWWYDDERTHAPPFLVAESEGPPSDALLDEVASKGIFYYFDNGEYTVAYLASMVEDPTERARILEALAAVLGDPLVSPSQQ